MYLLATATPKRRAPFLSLACWASRAFEQPVIGAGESYVRRALEAQNAELVSFNTLLLFFAGE